MNTQSEKLTFGETIARARAEKRLSLKDTGKLIQKEGGGSISAQYIHDIEQDRRTPSPHVLKEIATALGLDPNYLAALAGLPLENMTKYLNENPEQAPAMAEAFARANRNGFTDWDNVAHDDQVTRRAGTGH